MISALYNIIETRLKTLKNDKGTAVFDKEPQNMYREAVYADTEARDGWPIAVIMWERSSNKTWKEKERDVDTHERSNPTPDAGNSGTSSLSLSGNYAGNYDWTAEVITGGTVGTDTIVVRVTGQGYDVVAKQQAGAPVINDYTLDENGEATIGDGTKLTFAAGTLVVGDTWTWTTRNWRYRIYRIRESDVFFEVVFICTDPVEWITGVGLWADQLNLAFIDDRAIAEIQVPEHDITVKQIYQQELTDTERIQISNEKGRLVAYRYSLRLKYTGALETEGVITPLADVVKMDTVTVKSEGI